jgi:threonine/homoserine/homoserine lactone efflux protein
MITFAIAAFILAITPGPGLAYVVAKTVSSGRTEGLASCIGTAMGGLVHVLAAAFGLSLVIAKSAVAFNAIKFIGAAYLVFLGIRLLMRKHEVTQVGDVAAQGCGHAMIEGVMVEAMNVKTALFFLAFLPQFVSPASAMTGQLALLGSICVALNTLVDVVAVFTAERLLASESLRTARARLLTRISGATMIGLGAFLAAAKRHA